MSKSQFTDLYDGSAIQIWFDHEDESVTLGIHGRVTINLDLEEFKELTNAVFIAKQILKDTETNK